MKQPSIGVHKQAATVATLTRLIIESTSPRRVKGESLGACDGNNLLMGQCTTFSSDTDVWQPGVPVVWTAFYPL